MATKLEKNGSKWNEECLENSIRTDQIKVSSNSHRLEYIEIVSVFHECFLTSHSLFVAGFVLFICLIAFQLKFLLALVGVFCLLRDFCHVYFTNVFFAEASTSKQAATTSPIDT